MKSATMLTTMTASLITLTALTATSGAVTAVTGAPIATHIKGSMIERKTEWEQDKEIVKWSKLTYELIEMQEEGVVPHARPMDCGDGKSDPMYRMQTSLLNGYMAATGEPDLSQVPDDIWQKVMAHDHWVTINYKGFTVNFNDISQDHQGGQPTGMCCPNGPQGSVAVMQLIDGYAQSPPRCVSNIDYTGHTLVTVTDPTEASLGQPVKLKDLYTQMGSGAMFALAGAGVGFEVSDCGCVDNRLSADSFANPVCSAPSRLRNRNLLNQRRAKSGKFGGNLEQGNGLETSGYKMGKSNVNKRKSSDGKYTITNTYSYGPREIQENRNLESGSGFNSNYESWKSRSLSSRQLNQLMKSVRVLLGDKKSNNKNLNTKLEKKFLRSTQSHPQSALNVRRVLGPVNTYDQCQSDPNFTGHNMYPMPPFPHNNVQNLFLHMPPGSQGAITVARMNEIPDNMHTVFIDAETRQDSNGDCTADIWVKLPKTEGFMTEPAFQKLVSVDGVAWSCLRSLVGQGTWPVSGQPEWLLLDLIPALRAASGASPVEGETVKVVVKDANNNDVTRNIVLNYDNFRRFKPLLKQRSKQQHQYPCIAHHFDGPNVVKPSDFQNCPRDSNIQSRAPNDPATVAIASMVDNIFPLVFLTNEYDLTTGKKEGNFDPLPPDFASMTCKVRATGIYDAQGNPIWDQVPVTIVPKAALTCDPDDMKSLKTEIDTIINKMQIGQTAVSAGSLVALQSDTWTGCATLIEKSFRENFITQTVDTTNCIHNNPRDSLCQDSDLGEEQFCNLNPTHPWCADPCCYWKASRTKCCRAQTMSTSVMIPQMDSSSFGINCKFAGQYAPAAITASREYLDTQFNAKICIPQNEAQQAVLTTLENAAECCHAKISGVHGSKGKQSIQPCNTDEECLTGRCEIQTGSSSGSSGGGGSSSGVTVESPYDTRCFTDSTEISNKQGFCATADSTNFGEMLSKCITGTFESKNMPQAAAMFRHTLTGNYTATDAQAGSQLMSALGSYTCEGPDGYKYDPRNPCQNFNGSMCLPQNCNGADCQTACESAEKCNWAPWGSTMTAAQCSGASSLHGAADTHFCGMKRWGDEIESMTETAKCRPGGIRSLEPWVFQWESHYIQSSYNEYIYATNLTDAQCQTVLNDNTATKKFWRYDHDPSTHDQVPVYTCTLPGTGGNALTSADCLAACTGTNGFKPAKRYSCVKRPDNLAKCSDYNNLVAAGTEFRNEEDPAFRHAHHIKKRPQVCVPSGEWKELSVTISGTTSDKHWPWEFHWFEANTDAEADARCAAISNADITLEKVVMDDGKEQCRQDRCYKIGPTDWSSCDALLTATEKSNGAHVWWEETANNGNGLCTLRHNHHDHGGEHIWDQNGGRFRTLSDQQAMKDFCTTKGGTFYAGRSFEEGTMDSQSKCEAQYCDVMGPWAAGVSAQTCSSTTTCKGGHGCRGCRHNWGDSSSHWGVCTKATNAKSACDTLGWSYIPKVDGTTSLGMCYNPGSEDHGQCTDEWISCDNLNIDSCDSDATTPQGSGNEKTMMEKLNDLYLKCKPTQWGECNTKEKCDAGGECHGIWLPAEIHSQSFTGNDKSRYFAHTCVKEPGTETQKRTGNHCGIDTDPNTNSRLEMHGNHPHDPLVHHYGDKCAWYTYNSATECTNAGGQWISTQLNQQSCQAYKRCKGGRGDYHERDQVECEACGGGYNSDATWQDYEWTAGTMVSDPRLQWTARAMQKVNKWMISVDRWELNNALQMVRDRIMKESEIDIILCLWGKSASYMVAVGSICAEGYDYVAEETTLSQCEAMDGVEQDCGNTNSANTQIPVGALDSSSVTNSSLRHLSGSTMKMVTLKGETFEIGAAGRRRNLMTSNSNNPRWLSTASTFDASCYSVVMNSITPTPVLVGQLLGNCVALEATNGLTINQNSDGIDLCLPINVQIIQDSSYTTWAFAERTGSRSTTVGYKLAEGLTVSNSGNQLCAKVKKLDTFFCPAKVVPSAASKTTATGAFSCVAMTEILETVSQVAAQNGGNIEVTETNVAANTGSSSSGTNSGNNGAGGVTNSVAQKLSASVKIPLTVLATDTKESLLANTDFTLAIKKGIAASLDSELDHTVVDITDCTITNRRRSLESMSLAKTMTSTSSNSESDSEPSRKLSTVSKKVTFDYEVVLPSTFSAAKISSINTKTSAGGSGSSAFANSIQSNINAEFASSPALSSTYQSTGQVVVVGTASTETWTGSNDSSSSVSKFKSLNNLSIVLVTFMMTVVMGPSIVSIMV